MTILTPGQRRGIKGLYLEMPGEVKTLFVDLPALIESSFGLNIAVAYVFFRIEQAQRGTLYCGARKLHRTESELTWKAIDLHELTRKDFQQFFKTIYGFPVSTEANKNLEDAQVVRDSLMHGRQQDEPELREAICKVMHYAKEMNEWIAVGNGLGFKPFSGDLRGIVGRLEPLDRSTTRWILKGMGFELG